MHLAFQMGDLNSLAVGRTVGAALHGASLLGEPCLRDEAAAAAAAARSLLGPVL
jgi:hypothetical protein